MAYGALFAEVHGVTREMATEQAWLLRNRSTGNGFIRGTYTSARRPRRPSEASSWPSIMRPRLSTISGRTATPAAVRSQVAGMKLHPAAQLREDVGLLDRTQGSKGRAEDIGGGLRHRLPKWRCKEMGTQGQCSPKAA